MSLVLYPNYILSSISSAVNLFLGVWDLLFKQEIEMARKRN